MMTPAVRFSISLVLLSAIIVTGYHNSIKYRRDGVVNLFPFPRVGRSSWQVPPKEMFDEYEALEKRQLYTFPRVGRVAAGPANQGEPQPVQLRQDSPGMWFGPRLGRAYESAEDKLSIRNLNNERSELEQIDPDNEFRMKRKTDEK